MTVPITRKTQRRAAEVAEVTRRRARGLSVPKAVHVRINRRAFEAERTAPRDRRRFFNPYPWS